VRLQALTRSARGMTDRQCETKNDMCGLGEGRELKTTQVPNQASAGRSCTDRWTGEVPARAAFYHGDLLCAGERATQAMAGAWWWLQGTATKSWRRDLDLRVSSLFLGLMNRTTISTHGALSTGRVPVGRGQ
jgi:hypothetical protein